MTNEKIKEILDRCNGRFGWVQININTADNYLLMPLTELVEILEKQIPKKPSGDYHSVPHYRCPNCNREVVLYKDSTRYQYCKYCGQLGTGLLQVRRHDVVNIRSECVRLAIH